MLGTVGERLPVFFPKAIKTHIRPYKSCVSRGPTCFGPFSYLAFLIKTRKVKPCAPAMDSSRLLNSTPVNILRGLPGIETIAAQYNTLRLYTGELNRISPLSLCFQEVASNIYLKFEHEI